MKEIWLILSTVAAVVAMACLLRAWGHKVQLLQRDMLMHFACAVSDWIVLPFRKLLPLKPRSIDLASVLAALTVSFMAFLLMNLIRMVFSSASLANPGLLAWSAFGWLAKNFLYLVFFVVLLQVVLSWINPNAPVAPTLNLLTRPLLAPIRKFLPLIGGMDFSPLALILLINVGLLLFDRIPGF